MDSLLSQDWLSNFDASTVNVSPDISEDSVGFLEGGLDLRLIGHIAGKEVGVVPTQLINTLCSLLFVDVKKHYFAALRNEVSCCCQSKARASSRDEIDESSDLHGSYYF